jgi:hypothetical protein
VLDLTKEQPKVVDSPVVNPEVVKETQGASTTEAVTADV